MYEFMCHEEDAVKEKKLMMLLLEGSKTAPSCGRQLNTILVRQSALAR